MGSHRDGDAPSRARKNATMKKFVRIIGTRLGRYVEFEFSVNDADLSVELILPFSAFDEFCELQDALVLPPEPDVAETLERQARLSREPGLLRRVKDAAEEEAAVNKSDGQGGH